MDLTSWVDKRMAGLEHPVITDKLYLLMVKLMLRVTVKLLECGLGFIYIARIGF